MLIGLIACGDEDCDVVICNYESDDGTITVLATINSENPSVDINLYRGDYEKGNLVETKTTSSTRSQFIVPLNRYYSATIEYKRGKYTILAVNGGRLEYEEDDCGCQERSRKRFNLKLAKK